MKIATEMCCECVTFHLYMNEEGNGNVMTGQMYMILHNKMSFSQLMNYFIREYFCFHIPKQQQQQQQKLGFKPNIHSIVFNFIHFFHFV